MFLFNICSPKFARYFRHSHFSPFTSTAPESHSTLISVYCSCASISWYSLGLAALTSRARKNVQHRVIVTVACRYRIAFFGARWRHSGHHGSVKYAEFVKVKLDGLWWTGTTFDWSPFVVMVIHVLVTTRSSNARMCDVDKPIGNANKSDML